MPTTVSFCSRCGTRHAREDSFPRECAGCGHVTWENPVPVMVALMPVGDGVLCIKRGIPPRVGSWALPGGFHVRGESWKQAAVREVREETGQAYHPDDVRVMAPGDGWDPLFSTPGDNLLAFLQFPVIHPRDLAVGHVDVEIQGIEVFRDPVGLAFPSHTEALAVHLARDRRRTLPWTSVGLLEAPDPEAMSRKTLAGMAIWQFGLAPDADVVTSPAGLGTFEVFVRG